MAQFIINAKSHYKLTSLTEVEKWEKERDFDVHMGTGFSEIRSGG